MKKQKDLLLAIGGLGAFLAAYHFNILGIRNFIENLGYRPVVQQQQDGLPYPYPYPPTTSPQYTGARTLAAAHYKMAGAPPELPWHEARQPFLRYPYAAEMANPTLWWDKGGIVTPGSRIALPSEINYGPYQFQSPIFSSNRYTIQGTNIDYPFIVGPVGPSPCPLGEYRATDGKCYRMSAPPPEPCAAGYFRAADGKCYFMGP